MVAYIFNPGPREAGAGWSIEESSRTTRTVIQSGGMGGRQQHRQGDRKTMDKPDQNYRLRENIDKAGKKSNLGLILVKLIQGKVFSFLSLA